MRSKEELKRIVLEAIDARREEIFSIGDSIYCEPELGYKEYKTAEKVASVFRSLEIPFTQGLALTGLKGHIAGSEGPTVAVLGELDSVISPQHPDADAQTGAAHCCGHNCMIASMVGVAYALRDTDVMKDLSGSVALIAAPAEECLEIGFRKRLMDEGKISFIGGKQQLIKEGVFDDVDIALIMHLFGSDPENGLLGVGGESWNGFIGQNVRFVGKEAHAGMDPQNGINALAAARIALSAIDVQRETFTEKDAIRVHPIITKGGDIVNSIPAEVKVETLIRGASLPAILSTAERVTRSWKAGALALGADVEIDTLAGYLPFSSYEPLVALTYTNMTSLFGEDRVEKYGPHGTASSDIGDVAALLPTIQFRIAGANDRFHSSEYRLVDKETAYLSSAKILAMNVIDLLYDGGKEAQRIISDFEPLFTKEEYLKEWGEVGEKFK